MRTLEAGPTPARRPVAALRAAEIALTFERAASRVSTYNNLKVVPMSHRARFRTFALMVAVGLGIIGLAALAEADRPHVHGAYAFTQTRTCTVSNLPFAGPTFAIPSGALLFRQAASDSGVTTFHDDGTGISTGRSSSMNLTAFGGGVLSISEIVTTFEYTVNADGIVERTDVSTTFVTVLGSGTGNTGTVSGQVSRLQLAHGRSMLVSAPQEEITTETQVITPVVGDVVTQYRLCVRSFVGTRVPTP